MPAFSSRSVGQWFACLAAALSLTSGAGTTCGQATIDWGNANGGGYVIPSFWVGGVVPGALDTARFNLDQSYNVNFANSTISATGLTVGDGSVTFTTVGFSGSPVYAIADDATISGGDLTISSGTPKLNVQVGDLLTVNNGSTLRVISGSDVDAISLAIADGATIDVVGSGSTLDLVFNTITPIATIGAAGAGTLNVSGGGSFSSNTARLGTVAGSTGTATVSGADSTWTSFHVFVGDNGAGTLSITDGAVVNSTTSTGLSGGGSGHIGRSDGSHGVVNVSGAGSTWTLTDVVGASSVGALNVGVRGLGELTIEDGGSVSSNLSRIGMGGAPAGHATVRDAGSTWTNWEFLVGDNSWGTVLIEAGGSVSSTRGYIGAGPDGLGDVTVTGAGSSWTNSSELRIGQSGTGTLSIDAGGNVSNTIGRIASSSPISSGIVTVTGADSHWANSAELFVGGLGEGSLRILAGGSVTNTSGFIGDQAGSIGTATVTGAGSTWTNSNELVVGSNGTGMLDIAGGGVLASTEGRIGEFDGSSGAVTVTGAGSDWINSRGLFVGHSGQGTLYIEAGGGVRNLRAFIGTNANSSGAVSVTGAGSTWTNSEFLIVGWASTGTLTIEDGGQVTNTFAVIGNEAGSSGEVSVSGVGSSWNNSSNLTIGQSGAGTLDIAGGGEVTNTAGAIGDEAGSSGEVSVSGVGSTWTNSRFLDVGHNGTGTLTIEAGGGVSAAGASIGTVFGSTGAVIVTGAGSTLDTDTVLNVGLAGEGSLMISDGGSVSNNFSGRIGINNGGTVTVTGDGSTWSNSGDLTVGDEGTATLTIEAGGAVSNFTGLIGRDSTGSVTVSGAGSTWINNDRLEVGAFGTGTMTIQAGGSVSSAAGFLGLVPGSTGTVTVTGAGSTWTSGNQLDVGGSPSGTGGTATLNVHGGATVEVDGTLTIWNEGTVNLLGGTIVADELAMPGSTFNFLLGTLRLTSDQTIAAGNDLAKAIGDTPVFTSGKHLAIDGVATLLTTLTLGGGSLSTGSLVVNGALHFDRGTLEVSGGTITGLASLAVPANGEFRASGVHLLQITGMAGSKITATGDLTLGDSNSFLGVNLQGALDVGANSVSLHSAGFAQLGALTTLSGGNIDAPNGIALGAGDVLTGSGLVSGKVAASVGSLVRPAGGNLLLGDVTRSDGFVSDGVLDVGGSSVELMDANQAVLGALTSFGSATRPGTLVASNGLIVDFGRNIEGHGTIDTPNDPLRPTVVNGAAAGASATNQLTFLGHIKGVGTFDNVVFAGTFSPGLSPAALHVGSVAYDDTATLLIELGGTTPGNDFDQILSTGTMSLDGTLQVQLLGGFTPQAGDTFDILDWSAVSGMFAGLNLPTLAGLQWDTSQLYTDGVLAVAAPLLSGDYNGDGAVDAADYIVWRKTDGSPEAFNTWRANFGRTAASGATAGLPSSAAVPEPTSWMLLSLGLTVMLLARRRAKCVACLAAALSLMAGTAAHAQTTIDWGNASGGNYLVGTNWVGGVAPGADDTARFNLDATYDVTFGAFPATSTDLLVNDGLVTFSTTGTSGSPAYSIADDATIDGGDLTISRGLVSPALSVDVGGVLRVNDGTLSVVSGSLTSGATSVSKEVTGTASLTVDGPNSSWSSGFVSVGGVSGASSSSVSITGGGSATNTTAHIGQAAGSGSGSLTVSGDGSTWSTLNTLTIGATGFGRLNVTDEGHVTNAEGIIGEFTSDDGPRGLVNVSGAGSTWTNSGALTVGDAELSIADGGQVTSAGGTIAQSPGSTSTVTLDDRDSIWTNTGALYVGGSSLGPGGEAVLNVNASTTVDVAETLTVWDDGTVNLAGGTIVAGDLDMPGGAFNFLAGTLHLKSDETIVTGNDLAKVIGDTPVLTGGKRLAIDGVAVLLTTVTLDDASLSAGTLVISPGSRVQSAEPMVDRFAQPTVNGAVVALAGSTIDATQFNLIIGDAAKVNGFYGNGTLHVGDHTVTLADANDAVLDSAALVTLGNAGNPGTLAAANGLTLNFGGNITGHGTIDTPDEPAKPFINNGNLSGNSLSEPLTLAGYVKGVGNYDNVEFTGTFAPGFSPAKVNLGSAVYEGTLQIEIGGLTPGSGHDQLNHILGDGLAELGGTLEVSLINGFLPEEGHSFEIITATGGITGTFAPELLPTLGGGLGWQVNYGSNSVMLMVAEAFSAQTTWTAAAGSDWNNAANWDHGVPDANDAFVGAGATIATSADAPAFQRLNLQNTTGLVTIGHAMTLQRLDDNHADLVGNGTSGNLRIITGGSLTLTGDDSAELFDLHGFSAVSTATVDGGSLTATNASKVFRIGSPTFGSQGALFTLNSGTVDIAGEIRLGGGSSSRGTMNLNGGTFTFGANFVVRGTETRGIAQAVLNIDGATVLGTGTGKSFRVGSDTIAGDHGRVELRSGSLELGTNTTMLFGPFGSNQAPASAGRFVISGGDFRAPGEATLVRISSFGNPSGGVPTAVHGGLHQSGGTAHIEGELRIGSGPPTSTAGGTGHYVHLDGEMTVSNSSGTGLLRVAIWSELKIAGGTITADQFQIDAGTSSTATPGALHGRDGTLVGPINVEGILSPGFDHPIARLNSPGTLNIHGDLTLASTAETFFDFKDPTLAAGTFDSILNDGSNEVAFDGGLTLRFYGGEYQPGTVTLFESFANYSGDFDSLTVTGLTNGETATFDPANGTLTVVAQMLPADFNGDGSVNAADYIVWRKTDGSPESYNTWRANFGRTAGSAAAASGATAGGLPSSAAVPEPSAIFLSLGMASLLLAARRVRPTITPAALAQLPVSARWSDCCVTGSG